jgi:flagellar basal body-associated protein FliL
LAQPPANEDNGTRVKAKLTAPDAFLDELDGDPDQDPDALLAKYAPNFEKELSQLNADFADLQGDIETLDLDGDRIREVPISFKEKWKILKKKWKQKTKDLWEKLFYNIKYFFIWLALEAPKKVLAFSKKILEVLKGVFAIFANWSTKRKVLFFLATTSLSFTLWLYYKVVKGNVLNKESFHFYGSIAELATHSFKIDPDANREPFYNSPRVKAYSFQMKPLVANLKRRDTDTTNPMAFFEFVFEGSSGDVIVELKLRESEFIDVTERVVEAHYYEDLDTIKGKTILKEDLRRELNKQLTEGVIRRVEIRNFFIKP